MLSKICYSVCDCHIRDTIQILDTCVCYRLLLSGQTLSPQIFIIILNCSLISTVKYILIGYLSTESSTTLSPIIVLLGFLCVCVCTCISVCAPCACRSSWDQKRASESLELESWAIVSHHLGARDQTF